MRLMWMDILSFTVKILLYRAMWQRRCRPRRATWTEIRWVLDKSWRPNRWPPCRCKKRVHSSWRLIPEWWRITELEEIGRKVEKGIKFWGSRNPLMTFNDLNACRPHMPLSNHFEFRTGSNGQVRPRLVLVKPELREALRTAWPNWLRLHLGCWRACEALWHAVWYNLMEYRPYVISDITVVVDMLAISWPWDPRDR